ncbi:MAG: heme biosynthesis protein HemY [Methylobacteriaceae bacterium]|nr:heme biosynthesis protein HemY [Methylobacteriaceae bacterium]
MIRVLAFFAVLAGIAFGANWLADRPGEVTLTWQGNEYQVSLLVGVGILLAAAAALTLFWNLLSLVFGIPSRLASAARARRRNKGLVALTRGVVAVGTGDSRNARRHAEEAERLLQDEPLALFLKAQAAQLSGDRATAEASFRNMLRNPETQLLGLRGLHVEAQRRGDAEAAHYFAAEAQRLAPLPWAGQAVLDYHAVHHDWAGALTAVERNAAGKIIDKVTANRQRAVLRTAMALDKAEPEPEAALALARDAVKLAPGLVPATVLAARLMTRFGETRKATRLLEAGWRTSPHPDIAAAYLDLRPGDSARDRLARAKVLAEIAPDSPEGLLTAARAALEVRDLDLARRTMLPLFEPESPHGRPSVRACLLMADIEDTAGSPGRAREWLARAARAARDPAWIADGVVADRWSPVSPLTGRLDAFVWAKPSEQASGPPALPFPTIADAEVAHAEEVTTPSIAVSGSVAGGDATGTVRNNGAGSATGSDRPLSMQLAPASTKLSGAAFAVASAPAARATGPRAAAPARPVIFPLPLLPDDPGPDRRAQLRQGGASRLL